MRSNTDTGTQFTQPQQRNIQEIMRLEESELRQRSLALRIADWITERAGTTAAICAHIVLFAGWIAINMGLVPAFEPFDPWPFSFLTFVVSLEAIFLSLMVLMSENRLMKHSEHRAHLDLQLNMLAEQESTATLKMVRRICEHLGLEVESEDSAHSLEKPTDVREIAKRIEKDLPQ